MILSLSKIVMLIFLILTLYLILLKYNLRNNKAISIKGGIGDKNYGKFLLNVKNWNNPFTKDLLKEINRLSNTIQTNIPITTKDIKFEIPYHTNSGFIRNSCHNGQRKLFLSELQGLNKFPDVEYVIYVGSAPSRKSYIYHHLYPNTRFIFIDPAEFNIRVGELEDFLTEENIPIKDASTMYDNKNNIVWLYDNYIIDGDKSIYDIISLTGSKLYRGNNMYEIYDINTNATKYTSRLNGEMTTWSQTIYDIEDDPEKIKNYRDFITKSKYRIFLIQGFCTIQLCRVLKKILKNKKYGFWSDTRTTICYEGKPTDVDIVWNSSQNFNWIITLEPYYYMLKFRAPFYNMKDEEYAFFKKYSNIIDEDLKYSKKQYNIDFYQNYLDKKFQWLKGDIYIQCYAPITSTESRLISKFDKNNPLETFDIKKHEDKMFYYNNIFREFARYSKGKDVDQVKEEEIWKNYANINERISLEDGVNILNIVTKKCPSRPKQTWRNYKRQLLELFPWMGPYLIKNEKC